MRELSTAMRLALHPSLLALLTLLPASQLAAQEPQAGDFSAYNLPPQPAPEQPPFAEPLGADAQLANLSLASLLDMHPKTGSFLDLDLRKSPVSLTLITQDQVALSGARDISELLEIYVPGFQNMVNRWTGTIWGMRGVASDINNKFIFMINGNKLNLQSRDGALTDLALGSLGDVQRVEVLRGPSGIVYGSGAIAGVVNIVTRTTSDNTMELSSQVGAYKPGQTFQQHQAQVFFPMGEAEIAMNYGYRQSDGIGSEGRLYGMPNWPYPQWADVYPKQPLPTAGSAGELPGNQVGSVNIAWGDFNLYTRWSHQVQYSSGWFLQDPFPEIESDVEEDFADVAPDRFGPYASFWAQTESWGENSRAYQVDNLLSAATYDWELPSGDVLKLKASADFASDLVRHEVLPGFENSSVPPITEEFGERRVEAQAAYMFNQVDELQLALGTNFRWDHIGNSMRGINQSGGEDSPKKVESEVDYYTPALFFEGLYDATDWLSVHGGLRYDRHNRTDGFFSPKASLILTPHPDHVVKLFYQGSANNGTADVYEYNQYTFLSDGTPANTWRFEDPSTEPNANTQPLPPVSQAELHSLKPEESHSYELSMLNYFLDERLELEASVSYNQIKNIFMWSQELFRTINTGDYSFVNVDLVANWHGEKVDAGLSHTFLSIVDYSKSDRIMEVPHFDTDGSLDSLPWYENSGTADAPNWVPVATPGVMDTLRFNGVANQITVDGKNFLNLASNVTKGYIDFRMTEALTLHSDARIFWAPFEGRDYLIDRTTQYNGDVWYEPNDRDYMGMQTAPSVKLNLGARYTWHNLDIGFNELSLALIAYDVLADADSDNRFLVRNSLRRQIMVAPGDQDLYGMDQRAVSVVVSGGF
jgi:outer membrane receptor protein involved in Fe transport